MQILFMVFAAATATLVDHSLVANNFTDHEPRFGLTFTPSTIIASRYISEDNVAIIRFATTPEYRTYFRNEIRAAGSAQDDPNNNIDFKSILSGAMRPIIYNLTHQLGHAPEFSAISLPSIFQQRSSRNVTYTVFANSHYMWKTSLNFNVVSWPYGFMECRNLGREFYDCDGEGPESYVLVLEYEKEYLHASLVDVDFEVEVYSKDRERFCGECGEGNREKFDNKAYQNHLNAFIHAFLDEDILPHRKREDIQAIIVSGEASGFAAAELSMFAEIAVGTDTVKVMTEFCPSEVAARGAAKIARWTQRVDKSKLYHTGNMIPDERYWAEEEARKQAKENQIEEL